MNTAIRILKCCLFVVVVGFLVWRITVDVNRPEPPKKDTCPYYLTVEHVDGYQPPGRTNGGYPITTTDGSKYFYDMYEHKVVPYVGEKICVTKL